MGGLISADLLGFAGAMIAVIAGMSLLVAARTLVRRVREDDYDFAAGYNAMAAHTER
jgi:hypothetical protein